MATKITLRPGDALTRATMREAHEDGRHGRAPDVLAYWAECCADCYARWYYEEGPGAALLLSDDG
jgi:hypothetical protein